MGTGGCNHGGRADGEALYTRLSVISGGISQPTKLTKASLDDMRAGLAVKELPGLYQDAIAVAKRFGIGYIRIDSL